MLITVPRHGSRGEVGAWGLPALRPVAALRLESPGPSGHRRVRGADCGDDDRNGDDEPLDSAQPLKWSGSKVFIEGTLSSNWLKKALTRSTPGAHAST